jgi:hypothetical protein
LKRKEIEFWEDRNAVISYRLSVEKWPRPEFNEEATAGKSAGGGATSRK